MDGDEKLPDGWVKVKSKSRPDKQYFYNAALRISLWSLEDLKKHSKGSKKTPSTPAKNPKVASGVAAQSKQIKKNGAQDRMGKLQKVLADEVKRGKKSSADLSKKVEGLKEVISSGTNITVGKNIAAQRMAKLSNELKKELKDERMEQTIRKPKVSVMKFNAKEIEAKLKNTKVEAQEPITTDVDMMEVSFEHLPEDYEPMEWEDIPEQEIILQVQKIRTTGSQPSSAPPAMFSGGSQRSKIDFHVIVDTNVLLSNIDFVREIKGKVFKDIGRATIFLPYIVLCELDRLKTHNENVARLARRSISFIDDCFNQKDPFLVGQSAVESAQQKIIPIDTGDDEILNCCLQIQARTKKLILLTNDKNLRNKAFVNKIESFSRDMLNLIDFNMKNKIKFD